MPETILQKNAASVEELGAALANLVVVEDEDEVVIGKAWIAGSDLLVTCAHVVEPYLGKFGTLIAKFPNSGNRYAVLDIRLHPKFAKDQQTNNIAVLAVELAYPERELAPLPVQFHQTLSANDALRALELVPAHDGSTTMRFNQGVFCGASKNADRFSFEHSLALAENQAGAPIFAKDGVVGVYCGSRSDSQNQKGSGSTRGWAVKSTALEDLDLTYNSDLPVTQLLDLPRMLIGLTAVALMLGMVVYFTMIPRSSADSLDQTMSAPLTVTFDRPISSYHANDVVRSILVQSQQDCYVWALITDGTSTYLLYPQHVEDPQQELKVGQSQNLIPQNADYKTKVGPGNSEIDIFVFKNKVNLIRQSELNSSAGPPLVTLSRDDIRQRCTNELYHHPKSVWELHFDAPHAN